MADAIATGSPMAADVATALCTRTLQRVMNGTDRNAPPVPTMPAARPIAVPTANIANFPGKSRIAFGGLDDTIRIAVNQVKLPKMAAMARIGSALAIWGPSNEPTTSPGAMAATMGHTTAPRR